MVLFIVECASYSEVHPEHEFSKVSLRVIEHENVELTIKI